MIGYDILDDKISLSNTQTFKHIQALLLETKNLTAELNHVKSANEALQNASTQTLKHMIGILERLERKDQEINQIVERLDNSTQIVLKLNGIIETQQKQIENLHL